MRNLALVIGVLALSACTAYPSAGGQPGAGGGGSGGSGGSGGTGGSGGSGGTGGSGGSGGSGGHGPCSGPRAEGYGGCEMVMGWAYDAGRADCVAVSGCGCDDPAGCPEIHPDYATCNRLCGDGLGGSCQDVRNEPFSCGAGDREPPPGGGAGAPEQIQYWVYTGLGCEPLYPPCRCDPATDPCDSLYETEQQCLEQCHVPRPRCMDRRTPDECGSTGECRWLYPGCGGEPVPREGCYPAQDCGFDANACPPDRVCESRWANPCVDDGCAACGVEVFICVPVRDCQGAFLDGFGMCRYPDDGLAPPECCAPYDCDPAHVSCRAMPPACEPGMVPSVVADCWGPCVPEPLCAPRENGDEALCAETGGRWDPVGCGHLWCGIPVDCDAAIPGCDCGPGRNFVPGRGCMFDAACQNGDDRALCEATGGFWDVNSCGHWWCGEPPACDAIIPGCNCGDGRTFGQEGCMRDPSCPGGGACNSDADCPAGELCCYPCGVQGCEYQCMPPGADGMCPMFP